MVPDPDAPLVREPVSLRSRIVRAPGTRYSEVAGAAVVWEPSAGALHELSPAAAALWAALDGRPLGDLLLESAASGGPASTSAVDVVEGVRRLRALGLAADRRPGDTAVSEVETEGVPPEQVVLFGESVGSDGGVVLVIGGATRATIAVDVVRGVVLGSPNRADTSSAETIRGVVVLEPGRATPAELTPIGLLGALMAATAVHDELVLDALAGLAELVSGVLAADQVSARAST